VGASPAPSNPAPTNPGIASGEPAPVKRPATGYQLQGDRHLSVFFFAGVCDKYGLKTNESKAGQVDVQVVITQAAPKGQMCPALVKKQAVSADLQQPLAGRKVLDLGSGQVLPLDSDPNGGPQ
jgi:hypothetical protein